MNNALSKIKSILPPVLIGALALVGGYWFGDHHGAEVTGNKHHECHVQFTYINAELACDPDVVLKKTGYAETQGTIERFIEAEVLAGRLDEGAVYFRDLKAGPVFGVNETADFAPASLLKLPLALIYLLQAERDPALLTQELSVADPKWHFDVTFAPTRSVDPRTPHTVDELLMHSLVHSDNNSYGVLRDHLLHTNEGLIEATFLELGFLDPKDLQDEVLSVRRYGAIFRGLYNTSLVSPELSEKLLAWLAMSDFTQGLRGGIPESVPIAHKFGERITEGGAQQLHDCGIVYYPENPYLLCVMTRGEDINRLAAVIRHISEVVYQEVDSRRIK